MISLILDFLFIYLFFYIQNESVQWISIDWHILTKQAGHAINHEDSHVCLWISDVFDLERYGSRTMRLHADWKHIHNGWWWRGGWDVWVGKLFMCYPAKNDRQREWKSVMVTWRGRVDSCHRCGFTQPTTDCFRKSSLPPVMDFLGIWIWETPEWRLWAQHFPR